MGHLQDAASVFAVVAHSPSAGDSEVRLLGSDEWLVEAFLLKVRGHAARMPLDQIDSHQEPSEG